jgi:hypothetical protein
MYQISSSQRGSPRWHSQEMPSAMAKYDLRDQSRGYLKAQELSSLYEPEINTRSDRKLASCVQVGRADTNESKATDNKFGWLREVESSFYSTPPFMHSDSWQDTFSVSLSTSSSKGMSEDSVEFRKRLDLNYLDLQRKTQCAEIDSNLYYGNSTENTDHCRSNARTGHSDQVDYCVFELIKAQCLSNPLLMEKVVKWSITQAKCGPISQADAQKLSHGRLWITVKAKNLMGGSKEQEGLRDALDNMKGAYQEREQGVYEQPKPKGCEPRMQHRLLKNSMGLWRIEKYDSSLGVWSVVARELLDGRWKYCRHNRVIQVVVIPLRRILKKLRDDACIYQDVEKCVEFLFNSCDQRKLNGKLKTRNLKHNIANLRIKLEKQYSLSFAILVANTAEKMTCDRDFWHDF